ncbi:MAG: DUF2291 family protein [Synergistaceae bacterium]|nr:DUF2291 family protein [Synergistaceae bacterium]
MKDLKGKIIAIIIAIALVAFVANSAKVIDKGTEGQYTGVVAFDAGASSESDWAKISSEIAGNAQELSALNLSELGAGKAVKLHGTVSDFTSKANGKRVSITVTPENYSGNTQFVVQLGSIYTGTSVRDIQTVKKFGDFTNQTEWSQYAKALNSQLDKEVVTPLAINESVKGKTITITGAATSSGNQVMITPVAIVIE